MSGQDDLHRETHTAICHTSNIRNDWATPMHMYEHVRTTESASITIFLRHPVTGSSASGCTASGNDTTESGIDRGVHLSDWSLS